ncbi:hypothetical protein A3Q56_08196, partial [Intoshia linei]
MKQLNLSNISKDQYINNSS